MAGRAGGLKGTASMRPFITGAAILVAGAFSSDSSSLEQLYQSLSLSEGVTA
jgi:hypothetical protein